ncbi:MAG: DapH/DapD/GlmU-related protein [Candidatus Latescibacterota bacterium]
MSRPTLFDEGYERRKRELLGALMKQVRPIFAPDEVEVLRIDEIDHQILAQRSGRGFVNRDILETVLGNLLECVAPGSHNAFGPERQAERLEEAIAELADQLYAMIAQSLLAAGEGEGSEEQALTTAFALLWDLPRLKERALWNRSASLRDPAVWDAYLLRRCAFNPEELARIDFVSPLEEALRRRDLDTYRAFMRDLRCEKIVDYQLQLVTSTYPGWRVLLYHDIAHALTQSGALEGSPDLVRHPVPFLPRAVSELGARYYQADLHPETRIGDANFLDHTHRGITTGQTGAIGSGCHLFPCTMGGLSEKVQQRHPIIGDGVFIGTDAGLFGQVRVGDRAVIGPNTEIHGRVEIGPECHIGASVFVGTIKSGERIPGRVRLGSGVRVGAGTIIENASELDLVIPDKADIPARCHVANDGFGQPQYVRG